MLKPNSDRIKRYPSRYPLPTRVDVTRQVERLLLQSLKHTDVLFYLKRYDARLQILFPRIYESLGDLPIHLGVLKRIAREPFDFNSLDTRNMSWRNILDNQWKLMKDIKRSYDMKIRQHEISTDVSHDS